MLPPDEPIPATLERILAGLADVRAELMAHSEPLMITLEKLDEILERRERG